MALQIVILPAAQSDVASARDWYELQKAGLGHDFLDRFEECWRRILRNPELFGFAMKEVRRANLHRFPYAVLFRCSEESVIVLAVYHFSRDPEKWRERLS